MANVGDILFVEEMSIEALRDSGYWAKTWFEYDIEKIYTWAKNKEEAQKKFDAYAETKPVENWKNCSQAHVVRSVPMPAEDWEYVEGRAYV